MILGDFGVFALGFGSFGVLSSGFSVALLRLVAFGFALFGWLGIFVSGVFGFIGIRLLGMGLSLLL